MKRVLILVVFSIVGFIFLTLIPKATFAQCGTANCWICDAGPGGLCTVTQDCPGGYHRRDPSLCNTSDYCPSRMYFECDETVPDPGTSPCPASNPHCVDLDASVCVTATAGRPPGTIQSCTISPGVTGNCCIWTDQNDECGGHLQECCGGSLGVGATYCDPWPAGLVCNTTIDTPTCCYADDPDCEDAAPIPVDACSGTCFAQTCVYPYRLSYGQCDSTAPFCCTLMSTEGPEIFCVANDPEDRTSDPASGNIATAIGCIPVGSPQVFIGFLLRWGVGIAGGIAFILIIYSGFLVITSGGNPQKLQAGKELLTAAITGLVLLIFGAFILEFIGVDILNIPGFGQ